MDGVVRKCRLLPQAFHLGSASEEPDEGEGEEYLDQDAIDVSVSTDWACVILQN